MGRRKNKVQTKLLPRDEGISEDSISSGPDINELKCAVVQQPMEDLDLGEPDAVAGTALEDDKQNSDSEQTPKAVKKKEYKGNKLKKIQSGKQKESKKMCNAQGGIVRRLADKTRLNDSQSDGGDCSGEDEGAAEPTHKAPVEVLYCPFCTFPAEMCEFGGMMDKCRTWLLEHAPEYADADNLGRKRRILTEKEGIEAMIAGKGIKKALERHVVLELVKRAGKRKTTTVTGMDLFGFNLKDLSKEWRKTFSCGVGVRDAIEGTHQDSIDIQGDVTEKLVDILLKKYQIPRESVFHIVNKKKVKYFDDANAN